MRGEKVIKPGISVVTLYHNAETRTRTTKSSSGKVLEKVTTKESYAYSLFIPEDGDSDDIREEIVRTAVIKVREQTTVDATGCKDVNASQTEVSSNELPCSTVRYFEIIERLGKYGRENNNAMIDDNMKQNKRVLNVVAAASTSVFSQLNLKSVKPTSINYYGVKIPTHTPGGKSPLTPVANVLDGKAYGFAKIFGASWSSAKLNDLIQSYVLPGDVEVILSLQEYDRWGNLKRDFCRLKKREEDDQTAQRVYNQASSFLFNTLSKLLPV